MKHKKKCEACGCNPCDCGWGNYASVAQLVEHHVANVEVASSSLVSRSTPGATVIFAPLAQLDRASAF